MAYSYRYFMDLSSCVLKDMDGIMMFEKDDIVFQKYCQELAQKSKHLYGNSLDDLTTRICDLLYTLISTQLRYIHSRNNHSSFEIILREYDVVVHISGLNYAAAPSLYTTVLGFIKPSPDWTPYDYNDNCRYFNHENGKYIYGLEVKHHDKLVLDKFSEMYDHHTPQIYRVALSGENMSESWNYDIKQIKKR